jgi:hypothetical protein
MRGGLNLETFRGKRGTQKLQVASQQRAIGPPRIISGRRCVCGARRCRHSMLDRASRHSTWRAIWHSYYRCNRLMPRHGPHFFFECERITSGSSEDAGRAGLAIAGGILMPGSGLIAPRRALAQNQTPALNIDYTIKIPPVSLEIAPNKIIKTTGYNGSVPTGTRRSDI